MAVGNLFIMHSPTRTAARFNRAQKGFTLIELLIVLVISAILLKGGAALWGEIIPRQAVIANTNKILGFIYLARSQAMTVGDTLICSANTKCDQFQSGDLILVHDRNRNFYLDEDETIIQRIKMPESIHIDWRSFRAKPWLHFTPRGQTFYQSGHFLICSEKFARKIVVNQTGRARIEKNVPPEKCNSL